MVDHGEGLQLFGQCKVCIICSKDLPQDAAQQVRLPIPPGLGAVFYQQGHILTRWERTARINRRRIWRGIRYLRTPINLPTLRGIYPSHQPYY